MDIKTLIDSISKQKGLFSYNNFIELVAPASFLFVVMYINMYLFYEIQLFTIVNYAWGNIVLSFMLLLFTGWFLFSIRAYQLFWGYSKIKENFRIRITTLFEQFKNQPEDIKKLLGKYIASIYWDIIPENIRDNSINNLAKWVFLIHISVVIMISWLFILFVFITNFKPNFNLGTIIYFLAHILFYFYLRKLAIKNLRRSNFYIIDNINKNKTLFLKNIPNNINNYIDAI